MNVQLEVSLPRIYGPDTRFAYVSWVPSASAAQTITGATAECMGVKSVARTSAGLYVVTLTEKPKAMTPWIEFENADATNYHFCKVDSKSLPASGSATITVSHKTCVFASVAAAPTASDTIDRLTVIVAMRTGT